MDTILTAMTGLPAILPTAALVAALCFWRPAAVSPTTADSCGTDAGLRSCDTGGTPGGVAPSSTPPALSLAAWRPTCPFVRPLHRLVPDERGASRPSSYDRAA
jgi:hypothetical protein